MKSKGLKFVLVSLLFIAFVTVSIYAVYQFDIPGIISGFDSEKDPNDNEQEIPLTETELTDSIDSASDVPPDEPVSAGLGQVSYKPVDNVTLVETETWGLIPLNQIALMLSEKDDNLLEEVLELLKGEVVGEIDYLDMYQIEFTLTDEVSFNDLLTTVQGMEGVESAFPNMQDTGKAIEGTPCTPFTDPVFDSAGNRRPYEMIGMQDAWKIINLSGVKLNKTRVGVMDTALYTGSTETGGKTKIEGDTTDDPEKDANGNIEDGGHNHGTLVTHVIAANKENAGVAGIASILGDKLTVDVDDIYTGTSPTYVEAAADGSEEIYSAKYSNNRGYVIESLIKLHGQIKDGAKVINCSYGPTKPLDSNKWINKAYKKFFTKMAKDYPDVVFVAAAGNEGSADKSKGGISSENYYPGGLNLPNVITVGALNDDGSRASFSNFATGDGEVTLSAPGHNGC